MRLPRSLARDLLTTSGHGHSVTREVTVELPAGGTVVVRDVLDRLAVSHPAVDRRLRDERGAIRRFVNVYVAGTDVRHAEGLDTPVPSGAVVEVVQSVAGG